MQVAVALERPQLLLLALVALVVETVLVDQRQLQAVLLTLAAVVVAVALNLLVQVVQAS
jgi:hypothetical protein